MLSGWLVCSGWACSAVYGVRNWVSLYFRKWVRTVINSPKLWNIQKLGLYTNLLELLLYSGALLGLWRFPSTARDSGGRLGEAQAVQSVSIKKQNKKNTFLQSEGRHGILRGRSESVLFLKECNSFWPVVEEQWIWLSPSGAECFPLVLPPYDRGLPWSLK